jgi:Mannosyl-glycoprotein endo-beta-N-acetylglucosaminidase
MSFADGGEADLQRKHIINVKPLCKGLRVRGAYVPCIVVSPGVLMIKRLGAATLLSCAIAASVAQAAGLPAVKASDKNQVPACATPGRMMAYLKDRNPSLDTRFNTIAADYMQVGASLRVRWDYAFFQMVVDTGGLSFKNDGRSGDVRPEQNNFAGLGAVGNGARGESFPDVTTGVTAHLQHLLIYAGEKVPNAVAERTRKVQEWGVLNSWQKGIKSPITFTELARKWAPGAGDYGSTIESAAKRFYDDHCNKPDPAPELVATAAEPKAAKTAVAQEQPEKVSGAELARKSIAAARADSTAGKRTGLGATNLAKAAEPDLETPKAAATATPALTILNAPKPDAQDKPAAVQQASAGALAKPAAPIAGAKCRVYQASYGGQRAIIIRSKSEGYVNYTVLDVNEGAEKREADAYIQAYAKGGEAVGEFGNQVQALDKAFDLCPEG